MHDIINLLKNVYAGLDGISVQGLRNQNMVVCCAKGLRTAINALEGIQAAQKAADVQPQKNETKEE